MSFEPSSSSPGAEAIAQQASDWVSRRERGFTAAEKAGYAAWISADPRHAAATAEAELAFRLFRQARRGGQGTELRHEINQRVFRRRRRRWAAALALAGLASAAVWIFAIAPRGFEAAPSAVAAGRMQLKPERRMLPDGSVVELNAAGEIAVDFQPNQRNVRLLRGTAHFAVAKNPDRPFVVAAGGVSVRAVGTEFSVRFAPAEVQVLVTEGRVAVARPSDPAPPASLPAVAASSFLDAGQLAVIPTSVAPFSIQVQPAPPQAIQAAQAWRSLRVEFTDMRLREVVELFNRRNSLQLVTEGKAVEELLVSGVFWLDDPEGFSRLVAASAGLKPRADGQRIVLAQP